MGNVYLTGKSGNIGKRICEYNKNIIPVDIRLDESSLDFSSLSSMTEGDVLIHCAAISAPTVCASKYSYAYKINVSSTCDLIDKVIDYGSKVIFLSSDAVYGDIAFDFDETQLPNPLGAYGLMKSTVEKIYHNTPSFKSLRLSYVNFNSDRFTDYILDCASKYIVAEIFDPFARATVCMDDVIELIFSLVNDWVPERVINCGGPETISRIEFANILKEEIVNNLEFEILTPESEFYMDRPKIVSMKSPIMERILGRKQTTLREGIRKEFGII